MKRFKLVEVPVYETLGYISNISGEVRLEGEGIIVSTDLIKPFAITMNKLTKQTPFFNAERSYFRFETIKFIIEGNKLYITQLIPNKKITTIIDEDDF